MPKTLTPTSTLRSLLEAHYLYTRRVYVQVPAYTVQLKF